MKKKAKIILLTVLAICLLIAASLIFDFVGIKGGEEVEISVDQGESFSSVVHKMEEAKVIRNGFLFKRYAAKNGVDVALMVGNHKMQKNMGYKKAGQELISHATGGNVLMLTIPEGYEVKEITKEVEEKLGIPSEDFMKACEKSYDFDFFSSIPKRENSLEGYLFPNTYEVYKNASAEDVVEKMLTGFSSVWGEDFEKRAKELGMTMDEVIILASIIEREAGNKEEMPLVSSVFHNRLEINMPLQSCATVQYILKERKAVLSNSDTKIDSPYNTYLYPGLPVGPVSNPGRDAIYAALYPEASEYYYFRINESGKTVFTKTLDEHIAVE